MPVISTPSTALDMQALGKLAALHVTPVLSTRLKGLLPGLLNQIDREELIRASVCFEIMKVEKTGIGFIKLFGGGVLEAPLLAHRMAPASHLLLGVATIGDSMAKTIRRYFADRQHLKAVLMEDLANAALFKIANSLKSLADQQASKRGMRASGPLSPGDHEGFNLDQQASILVEAKAERIGVGLTKSGLMNPAHSLSVVVGLGKNMRHWTKDEDCKSCRARDKCRHYLRFLETAA